MIPFVTLSNKLGQQFTINPELVQFIRLVDRVDYECLIIFGKNQVLRINGSLDEVTDILRNAETVF